MNLPFNPLRSRAQAIQWMDEQGLSKAELARRFDVTSSLVDAILRGTKPCKRGASHNIAVFLGLKHGQAVATRQPHLSRAQADIEVSMSNPQGFKQDWSARRVDQAMCINFQGRRWSVMGVPGAYVGDRVFCRHQGAEVLVRAYDSDEVVTLASSSAVAPDLPAWPQQAIVGADYVHRPTPAPAHAGSCVLCEGCPNRRPGAQTPATGASA